MDEATLVGPGQWSTTEDKLFSIVPFEGISRSMFFMENSGLVGFSL